MGTETSSGLRMPRATETLAKRPPWPELRVPSRPEVRSLKDKLSTQRVNWSEALARLSQLLVGSPPVSMPFVRRDELSNRRRYRLEPGTLDARDALVRRVLHQPHSGPCRWKLAAALILVLGGFIGKALVYGSSPLEGIAFFFIYVGVVAAVGAIIALSSWRGKR